MNRPYQLRDPILVWFAANHDEELTGADIALRWDATHDQVRHATAPLCQRGWLKREKREDSRSLVYSAGPLLHQARGVAP